MSDFANQFQSIGEFLGSAAKGVMGKLDQWSFKMLVDNLKSDDTDVAGEAIDQIAREKKPLGIPPLYFVYQQHPNNLVRIKAEKALKQFEQWPEIQKVTEGKSPEEATKALIMKYGNYKGNAPK